MDATVIDQATAAAVLRRTREDLVHALKVYGGSNDRLVELVVEVRPKGLLTVDEMAKAIGRDRNYVDSVWSLHGKTVTGAQTRVPVLAMNDGDSAEARRLYDLLASFAAHRQKSWNALLARRAERDRVVTMVYAAGMKDFGPSPIAREVGIDRNHVLRIARKAGVKPVHRTGSKNQYTSTG